jgi:hypothetical protein
MASDDVSKDEGPDGLHIHVKALSGERGEIEFTLPSLAKFVDVKQRVEREWAIPIDQQILVLNGQRYDTASNPLTLSQNGVNEHDVFTMIQVAPPNDAAASAPPPPPPVQQPPYPTTTTTGPPPQPPLSGHPQPPPSAHHEPPSYTSTIQQGEDVVLPLSPLAPLHLGLAWEFLPGQATVEDHPPKPHCNAL